MSKVERIVAHFVTVSAVIETQWNCSLIYLIQADPGGRAAKGAGLRPLAGIVGYLAMRVDACFF